MNNNDEFILDHIKNAHEGGAVDIDELMAAVHLMSALATVGLSYENLEQIVYNNLPEGSVSRVRAHQLALNKHFTEYRKDKR